AARRSLRLGCRLRRAVAIRPPALATWAGGRQRNRDVGSDGQLRFEHLGATIPGERGFPPTTLLGRPWLVLEVGERAERALGSEQRQGRADEAPPADAEPAAGHLEAIAGARV